LASENLVLTSQGFPVHQPGPGELVCPILNKRGDDLAGSMKPALIFTQGLTGAAGGEMDVLRHDSLAASGAWDSGADLLLDMEAQEEALVTANLQLDSRAAVVVVCGQMGRRAMGIAVDAWVGAAPDRKKVAWDKQLGMEPARTYAQSRTPPVRALQLLEKGVVYAAILFTEHPQTHLPCCTHLRAPFFASRMDHIMRGLRAAFELQPPQYSCLQYTESLVKQGGFPGGLLEASTPRHEQEKLLRWFEIEAGVATPFEDVPKATRDQLQYYGFTSQNQIEEYSMKTAEAIVNWDCTGPSCHAVVLSRSGTNGGEKGGEACR
jgi:hypothetical protein